MGEVMERNWHGREQGLLISVWQTFLSLSSNSIERVCECGLAPFPLGLCFSYPDEEG